MDNVTLKNYYNLFTDIWKVFRKYSNPDGSMEYWQALVKESNCLNKKYHQSELYQDLSRAVIKEISRIEKNQKGMEADNDKR